LALAVAAEIVSFVAAAELQHHLLVGTGTRVDRLSLVALTYAGMAMSATLPAGPAVSGRYMYRTLVRRGSSAASAAWVLAATALLSLVSLLLLGLVGAQIRGFGVVCSAVGAGVGVSVLLIAAVMVWALVWSSSHRRRVELLASSVSAWWNRKRQIMGRWLGRPYRAAHDDSGGLIRFAAGDVEHRHALGAARLSAALGLAIANRDRSRVVGRGRVAEL
jgi:uncharacterized membrane protein YbhN (UPF0104 family)